MVPIHTDNIIVSLMCTVIYDGVWKYAKLKEALVGGKSGRTAAVKNKREIIKTKRGQYMYTFIIIIIICNRPMDMNIYYIYTFYVLRGAEQFKYFSFYLTVYTIRYTYYYYYTEKRFHCVEPSFENNKTIYYYI